MTTLKNLKGTAIQFLDADPVVYAGSWSSGGALNTARQALSGNGIQTAALAIAGAPARAITESYNGTAWTEVADLNTGRDALASQGTYTAALAFGGNLPTSANSASTETWNGSSWTEVNDLNAARRNLMGSEQLTQLV